MDFDYDEDLGRRIEAAVEEHSRKRKNPEWRENRGVVELKPGMKTVHYGVRHVSASALSYGPVEIVENPYSFEMRPGSRWQVSDPEDVTYAS